MHCSWSSSSLVTFVVIIKLIFPDELLELVSDLNEVNYEINDKFSSMVQSISMPNVSKVGLQWNLERDDYALSSKISIVDIPSDEQQHSLQP